MFEDRIAPDVATSSEEYQSRFSGKNFWLLEEQQDITRKILIDSKCREVVDVGGGHGQSISQYKELSISATITGSDEVCRTLIKNELNANIQFETRPLIVLDQQYKQIDMVVSYRTLPHVDEWEKFVESLCRLSGKHIVVDYPVLESVNAISPMLFRLKKGVEKNTRTFSCFNKAQIVDEFAKHGFSLKTSYPQFLFPMALHRAIKSPRISRALEHNFITRPLKKKFGSPIISVFEKSD